MKLLCTLILVVSVASLLPGQETTEEKRLIAVNQKKLSEIILPEVNFQDAKFGEAIAFLRDQSRELDTTTEEESQKGLNFILDLGEDPARGDVLITLRLKNVPLGEAIRYATSLAEMKYKVEPYAVMIQPR